MKEIKVVKSKLFAFSKLCKRNRKPSDDLHNQVKNLYWTVYCFSSSLLYRAKSDQRWDSIKGLRISWSRTARKPCLLLGVGMKDEVSTLSWNEITGNLIELEHYCSNIVISNNIRVTCKW